mmetsp:Transcript_5181/g.13514  ORF Transcript_5181/g.13514 Transcript_5181/m.13514 type:complete len:226 (+) Transcript_5181:358-1035(+)
MAAASHLKSNGWASFAFKISCSAAELPSISVREPSLRVVRFASCCARVVFEALAKSCCPTVCACMPSAATAAAARRSSKLDSDGKPEWRKKAPSKDSSNERPLGGPPELRASEAAKAANCGGSCDMGGAADLRGWKRGSCTSASRSGFASSSDTRARSGTWKSARMPAFAICAEHAASTGPATSSSSPSVAVCSASLARKPEGKGAPPAHSSATSSYRRAGPRTS